jgi:hypothetical protein
MKSSIIRSLVIFAAGAGSATVVAGLYPPIEPKSPEQLLADGMKLLPQVERFGSYVGVIKDGRIGMYTNVGACVPQPPLPKWPAHAVDQRSTDLGLAAIGMLNKAFLAGEERPIYVLGKCRPYAKDSED